MARNMPLRDVSVLRVGDVVHKGDGSSRYTVYKICRHHKGPCVYVKGGTILGRAHFGMNYVTTAEWLYDGGFRCPFGKE